MTEVAALKKEVQDLTVALTSLQQPHADVVTDLSRATKQVKQLIISNASDSFGIANPVYNCTTMSSDHFLIEAEEYLVSKGILQANWLLFVSRMLPKDSDVARWYRATKASIHTWDEFKTNFRAYENSDVSCDLLTEKLFSKRQRIDEPFESYAWDLYALYQKIEGKVDQGDVINRILNSCLPEIAAMLTRATHGTVTDLIIDGKQVIMDLNKIHKVEGKILLRARQSDQVFTKPQQSSFQRQAKTFPPNNKSGAGNSVASTSTSTPQQSTLPYC